MLSPDLTWLLLLAAAIGVVWLSWAGADLDVPRLQEDVRDRLDLEAWDHELDEEDA